MKPVILESYPLRIVLIANILSIFIWVLGFMLMLRWSPVAAILYLAYILALEFRLMRYHCTDCYYYGKTCGFGKGRISALLFSRGENSRFFACEMTWRDMAPDMLVTLAPMLAGIVMLVMDFDALYLSAIILMVLLATAGNGLVRGRLTCAFCRQRELGCPAERLFSKK